MAPRRTPLTAHRDVEDPAAFVGPHDEMLGKFREVDSQLERRIQIFVNLPMASLDKLTLQERLDEIGKVKEQPAQA